MASWAAKRRLLYIAGIIGFFLLVFSYPIFSIFYEPPSCTDGIQNQDETGIDCGGTCEAVCEAETVDPIVLWSQEVEVKPGQYDAVAHIENPNIGAGVSTINYSFKLYDESGILVAEREGETFINPNERATIFEGAINTGKRVPVRTFFEFTTEPRWTKVEVSRPILPITNQVFTDDGIKPKLKAELGNELLDAIDDITIVALIFDEDDNVIAASKTGVDRLKPQSSKTISFIWPQTLKTEPTRIEIVPRVNIVDL